MCGFTSPSNFFDAGSVIIPVLADQQAQAGDGYRDCERNTVLLGGNRVDEGNNDVNGMQLRH